MLRSSLGTIAPDSRLCFIPSSDQCRDIYAMICTMVRMYRTSKKVPHAWSWQPWSSSSRRLGSPYSETCTSRPFLRYEATRAEAGLMKAPGILSEFAIVLHAYSLTAAAHSLSSLFAARSMRACDLTCWCTFLRHRCSFSGTSVGTTFSGSLSCKKRKW